MYKTKFFFENTTKSSVKFGLDLSVYCQKKADQSINIDRYDLNVDGFGES
jgi:hypothetical protein